MSCVGEGCIVEEERGICVDRGVCVEEERGVCVGGVSWKSVHLYRGEEERSVTVSWKRVQCHVSDGDVCPMEM